MEILGCFIPEMDGEVSSDLPNIVVSGVHFLILPMMY